MELQCLLCAQEQTGATLIHAPAQRRLALSVYAERKRTDRIVSPHGEEERQLQTSRVLELEDFWCPMIRPETS